jgi:phosphoglycolate phosphatase-like HAD superfamily hydrolase
VAQRLEGLRPARTAYGALKLKYRGLILDVDGTLIDSNDAHARAFAEALQVPVERVRPLIGKGADKLMPELIGRYDAALAERKKAIFKARFLPGLRPFPRCRELLARFKGLGFRLVAASSAGKDELDDLLAVAGAHDYLEAQIDADDAERSKPDPDIVLAALDKLRLPAAQCLMLGDTPYDAQAAARAGVAFVGLRCGGWSERDLQPALAVFADPAALLCSDFTTRV